MSPLLMTVRESAGFLGRSQEFVRGLCHSGTVDYVIVNGRYYIYRAALLAFLEGGEPAPRSSVYVMPME